MFSGYIKSLARSLFAWGREFTTVSAKDFIDGLKFEDRAAELVRVCTAAVRHIDSYCEKCVRPCLGSLTFIFCLCGVVALVFYLPADLVGAISRGVYQFPLVADGVDPWALLGEFAWFCSVVIRIALGSVFVVLAVVFTGVVVLVLGI